MLKTILLGVMALMLSGCFNGDDSKSSPMEKNQPPVAADSQLITQTEVPVSDSLQASDEDNDPLSFALEQEANNGMVTISQNGDFTYTPDNEFTGQDSFTFSVTDNQNPAVMGEVSVSVEALQVLFSNLSREAFAQAGDDMPLRLNGRVVTNDVTSEQAYDDLLID